ncbi:MULTISPECIES: gp53-like domain-containing protein [Lonsdalea]|uniref:Uncharacterized protein n=2 Tax=Lonsdalea TaxID=1082702 RepID=A0ACD1JFX0_9GAMM|nr:MULTISPECIES: hypothetical protein [Lonsdalea]RAT16169.1 hypothetical protein AU485_01785 [Lonsdalea quercina]RAT23912.1 hypothetical protein AU487_00770 [Lonsdalea populi]RAT25419.1 hypothetical protein AU489_06885 [Lonsdalea populi]RAT28525.1 hypothetical protein AU488_00675 [Lonsdalea populi]RAT38331.1 hypothetical protein AU492_00715 [Lonsdalea populi]
MHRIDTGTAQVDKFGAGKNGFTRGNPQTGTLATELDDDYFDALQEEICGPIEAAGLSLEKGNRGQLLAALRSLFLSRSNPGSDISNDGANDTFFKNLGLGEAAKRGVGTGQNQIPDMSFFTGSNETDGYVPFPGGLIMQWGSVRGGGNSVVTANFKVPFPSGVFVVVGCIYDDDNTSNTTLRRKTSSEPRVNAQFYLNDGISATSINWVAIGM